MNDKIRAMRLHYTFVHYMRGVQMFGRWSRNQERQQKREERRKRRRLFFASLVRKFTESIAFALVAKYGALILIAVLVLALVALHWFFGGW